MDVNSEHTPYKAFSTSLPRSVCRVAHRAQVWQEPQRDVEHRTFRHSSELMCEISAFRELFLDESVCAGRAIAFFEA